MSEGIGNQEVREGVSDKNYKLLEEVREIFQPILGTVNLEKWGDAYYFGECIIMPERGVPDDVIESGIVSSEDMTDGWLVALIRHVPSGPMAYDELDVEVEDILGFYQKFIDAADSAMCNLAESFVHRRIKEVISRGVEA